MQKLTAELDRKANAHRPAPGLAIRLKTGLEQIETLGADHRVLAGLICVAGIGAIGWLNFTFPRTLHLDYFYLFACIAAGWVAGTPSALVCTALTGCLL